jgi:hypothetical protein
MMSFNSLFSDNKSVQDMIACEMAARIAKCIVNENLRKIRSRDMDSESKKIISTQMNRMFGNSQYSMEYRRNKMTSKLVNKFLLEEEQRISDFTIPCNSLVLRRFLELCGIVLKFEENRGIRDSSDLDTQLAKKLNMETPFRPNDISHLEPRSFHIHLFLRLLIGSI